MEPRTERVYIRMTPKEKRRLMKRAKRYSMTASNFARTLLVHSDDGFIRIVDVEPLRRTLSELTKQGTNLNQLMKFLNTNGVGSYDADRAQEALRRETKAFAQVANALIALREEMGRHGVVLIDDNNDAEALLHSQTNPSSPVE